MKVLTANRLSDGEAVWYSSGDGWIETLEGADVAEDKLAESLLEGIGKVAYETNQVVDVNLIDVNLVDGIIVPTRLREQIRAAGPTNRTDLGKQARAEIAA
jgi:hypothetical protein